MTNGVIGEEGPRYVWMNKSKISYCNKRKDDSIMNTFEFNGEKYKKASKHQKEWGNSLISELSLSGNEEILDLGCGDGGLTEQLAQLVPNGRILGIDASAGMIDTAQKRVKSNLAFMQMDINTLDFENRFDVIFSNAALHWVNGHGICRLKMITKKFLHTLTFQHTALRK